MKKQKFTETQVLQAIKQYEGGRDALDVSREFGISQATMFNCAGNTVECKLLNSKR